MIAEKIVNSFCRGLSMATVTSGLKVSNPELARILNVGGDRTAAGVRVDHQNVMALPAVMRACSIVASSVAAVPFQVVKVDGDTETPEPSHIAWNVIVDNPSEEEAYTQDVFRETMTHWAMTWGNAVAHISRPDGWPKWGEVHLTPLLPDRTTLYRLNKRDVKRYDFDVASTGMLFYQTIIDGQEYSYPVSDCLHIRGLGSNPFWGYDIIDVLIEAFGGAKAAREYGHRFFGQGANPAGFVEAPVGLSNEAIERMTESVNRGLGGLGKAHRMMVLEEGAKFSQWSVDPEKAQFLEGKEFDIRELAMAIGIKVHKLIDSKGTSYNSLSESNKEHKDDDLLPWLRRWKNQYRLKLLTKRQRQTRTHDIVFDDKFLEYVSFADKARGTVDLFNNGVINKEEARRGCGYGPSLKPNGNRYRKPLNIGFEDEQKLVMPGTPPPADPPEDPDDAEVRSFVVQKESRRLYHLAVDAAKTPKAFIALLDRLSPPEVPKAIQAEVDELYKKASTQLNEIADSTSEPELLETVRSSMTPFLGE